MKTNLPSYKLYFGRKLSAGLLFYACLVMPLAFAQDDEPPSMPLGLLAYAWSGTAGEIQWQRSTDDQGAVPGYELTRNGTVLGVFDALSYFDDSLAPGTAHDFTVVAIDSIGQRSAPASITLMTPGSPGPSAPAGLRAQVYSSSAAELFWDRPATFGLTYEVRRNGLPVAVTDGVSFTDQNLTPATRYSYEVTAVAASGERSVPARVELTTRAGSAPPYRPAPPIILDVAIYSDTAIELFWRRPATFGLVYEVRRDGEVQTVTDGVSYFDEGLDPAVSYTYELIAIDRDGRRSDPVTVIVQSGDDSDSQPDAIRPDNAIALLQQSIEWLFREFGRDRFAVSQLLSFTELVPLDTSGSPYDEQISSDCPAGGTVERRATGGAGSSDDSYRFIACAVGGAVADGSYETSSEADGLETSSIYALQFTGVDTLVGNGELDVDASWLQSCDGCISADYEIQSYTAQAGSRTVAVSGDGFFRHFPIAPVIPGDPSTARQQEEIVASDLRIHYIDTESGEDFDYRIVAQGFSLFYAPAQSLDDAQAFGGRIELLATDGSAVSVKSTSGAFDMVDVIITDSDGFVTGDVRAWSDLVAD